ncbi:Oxysterol binding protein [Lunasporangiospora selenospora]|uniref:Oxysterol binding protein n=1 Tax=Lunasporangiospora selenospora TaxID=979761 RepID=A0A9P6KCD1_9FUNG|nr:Oxysterol binding protein [Lunasporangiospora selenospora]
MHVSGQYWGDHPKLFADISLGETPEDRLLNSTRWFISTLSSSYYTRSTKVGMEKKPYNPILGEQYFGKWSGDEKAGDLILTAEQVSHHPPIMGFHLENEKAGVILEGHCGQKSRFAMPAGVDVSQTGHAILSLPKFNEKYLITLPNLNIRGVVTGRPTVELSGTTYIVSSAGMYAAIEYSTKGYFSGEKHSFKATLKPLSGDGAPFYITKGTWSGASEVKKGNDGDWETFFDAQEDKSVPPELKPVSEMDEKESLKLWTKVTKAINEKDYGTASKEKSQIEEAQRALARARKEKGETQADALVLFSLVSEDADESGKAFVSLKEKLIAVAGPKAIKEDDQKPHWRLRK